jgi:hypothetical protein
MTRHALTLGLVALGTLLACGNRTTVFSNNGGASAGGDEGGSTTTTTSHNGGGPSTGGNPVGQGGGAQGGDNNGGEPTGPCGIDCNTIDTPSCYVAVCNEGQHPGPVGSCVVVPEDATAACDDGAFCTTNDACDGAGVCVGGPANTCGVVPGACQNVSCNEGAQSCSAIPKGNGVACTAADPCQVGGQCTNGMCVGVPKDCFFAPVPNECHESQCNPANGMCEPIPANFGAACTDLNDLCTITKTCDMMGSCVGGAPKNCSQLTMGCNIGICDTTTGQCTTMAVMNGQICDDLNGCTTNEICTNSTCGGGMPVTVCSGAQIADGCCPAACSVADDLDCAVCAPTWDDGTLQGWAVTSTCPAQNNWQPDTTRAQSGSHSLYYGNPALNNYVCTGAAHSSTATSKPINLQPGNPNVSFWVWIHTEGGTTYDQLGLWVMPASVKIWDRNNFPQGASGNTGGVFVQQTVDLSGYANQTIQLQFRFNTVDSIANSTEGVYIDTLVAQGSCP